MKARLETQQQIKTLLELLSGNKTDIVSDVMHFIEDKNITYQEQLLKVLQVEQTQSFFEKSHYLSTCEQKEFFDYATATEFSAILGKVFPKIDFYSQLQMGENQITKNCTSTQIVHALDTEGYFVFPHALSETIIDKIIHGVSDLSFGMNASHKVLKITSPQDLPKMSDNTAWVVDQQKVLQIPEVQQLILDPILLDSIQTFLGCQPIHVQTNTWWSKAESHDELAFNRSAQLYHQDKEFIKFLKVFIYLNDVEEENGPHQYIAGSHKNYSEHVPADYQMSQRLSDDYLQSVYPASDFRSLKGKKGTVIIEDTSGFHKGKPLQKGYRQLLQLEFVSSLYFNPVPSFSTNGFTKAYQEFLNKNPRFALNYNAERYETDLQLNAAERKKYLLINAKANIRKIGRKIKNAF